MIMWNCRAQHPADSGSSPFQHRPFPHLAIGGLSAGLGTAGLVADLRTKQWTEQEVLLLQPADVIGFDRSAIGRDAHAASVASDVFAYTSLTVPLLLLADPVIRSDALHFIPVYLQTMGLAATATYCTKKIVGRQRPQAYDATLPPSKRLNDQSSFFSGHTSMTAANLFFSAAVLTLYHRDTKWLPVVWGTAAAIPAFTAFLRYRGGHHFPSDVLAGYAAGALVGALVPLLFRNHTDRRNAKPKIRELYQESGSTGFGQ